MKLVRDKIPQIIESTGRAPAFRMAHGTDEIIALLKGKMVEEVEELIENPCVEEAADVFEVFREFCIRYDILVEDVIYKATHKRCERGGFSNGVVLIENDHG